MMASVWHRVICRQVSHVSYVEVQFVTRLTRPATHTSRSKKCLYVSLLQDGGSVDSANWQGLHSKPLWKAVPCERRPGDQVISACMPPLRRHSCVYKSEGPNPSPAHDAERTAVRNNAMEGVRRKHARTRDMMPAAACATVNHHQNTPQNRTKTKQKRSATPPTAAASATAHHHQNKPQNHANASKAAASKPPSEHAPKPDKNQTKTQRHTAHEKCLTSLSEALKKEDYYTAKATTRLHLEKMGPDASASNVAASATANVTSLARSPWNDGAGGYWKLLHYNIMHIYIHVCVFDI